LAVGAFYWHGEAEMKNPPAFPRSMFSQNGPFSSSAYSEGYGMDLRDYFAAKAMQGLIASPRMPLPAAKGGLDVTDVMVADLSYKMADAMLKQREA
jgi:hypothetical protein